MENLEETVGVILDKAPMKTLFDISKLKVVGPCYVFERAATRVQKELEKDPIDQWYSGDWADLAGQVVGRENLPNKRSRS